MYDFKDKNKFLYIFYEMLGMSVIMVGSIYGDLAGSIFVASLISWELSAAHFNIGLTLAEICMNF